jgi:hypothetical protein
MGGGHAGYLATRRAVKNGARLRRAAERVDSIPKGLLAHCTWRRTTRQRLALRGVVVAHSFVNERSAGDFGDPDNAVSRWAG